MDDLYWDDDYDGMVSPKTWMKSKYSAPYYYGGLSEHYLFAHREAIHFAQNNSVLQIPPSFDDYLAGKTESYTKKLEETSLSEMSNFAGFSPDHLLERLSVSQVFCLSAEDGWEARVSSIAQKAAELFERDLFASELMGYGDDYDKWLHYVNPSVIPLADTLLYSYDYGDGWELMIHCTDIIEVQSAPSEAGFTLHSSVGEDLHDLESAAETVLKKQKPICLSASGFPVMDDVGGLFGYCEFLKGIHGLESEMFDYDDSEEIKGWARSQGWTGKMTKAERIL